MNADVLKLLESQAAWQRARARLTWPEKLRLAETMRDAALKLRACPVLKDESVRSPSPIQGGTRIRPLDEGNAPGEHRGQ
jgi:hypothetical protein